MTGSSIIPKDRGLGGEAGGCSLIPDLEGGGRVAASVPGPLGLSILLRHPGRCLRGGRAGVPLASHEGEHAGKQNGATPEVDIR